MPSKPFLRNNIMDADESVKQKQFENVKAESTPNRLQDVRRGRIGRDMRQDAKHQGNPKSKSLIFRITTREKLPLFICLDACYHIQPIPGCSFFSTTCCFIVSMYHWLMALKLEESGRSDVSNNPSISSMSAFAFSSIPL